MKEFTIRSGNIEDLDGILDLERICFTAPWSRQSLEYDMGENRIAAYFVAEHENKVVGYIGFWSFLDECHINNVAVSPLYRKMHIGSALMAAVVNSCAEKNITRFTLEVRRSNVPAIGLYKKFAFKESGTRKAYYGDNGEDAIIMWRG